MAARSRISKVAYTEESVETLFREFRKEAAETLLFLKSVRELELFVFDPGMPFGVVAPRRTSEHWEIQKFFF